MRLPWKIEEQPRLDSTLTEGLEDFVKTRFEFGREPGKGVDQPQPAQP